MRYPPSLLEEIKARLPASVVIGRRVQLKRAGREWKGLSPFNKERTPSFHVNDQKQAWFDFSAGKNGDIFGFVMETEGLSFPEAVERLAAEAGVTLPKVSAEAEQQEQQRAGLQDVVELSAQFFEAQLRGREGAEARRYLTGRELGADIQAEFRLGYAPNERFALRDFLAGKGIPAELMSESGMLIHGEDIPVPYDRFRDRVMFPICDARGRVIAFGGRAMQKDAPAKYLNSPETPLFHKGATLFNHHRARKAAHDSGAVIAVEGYVDVIALHRSGLAHAVAPLGTALTGDQIRLMWRMAAEPVLCFDGDKAGQRAAFRAVDVVLPLLEAGKSLRFAFLPAGQDPDDLLRGEGPEALRAVIGRTKPLVDMLWTREQERVPLDTPERRADFERRVRTIVASIRDDTIRKHYVSDVDQRVQNLLRPARPAQGARQARGAGQFQPNQRSYQRGQAFQKPQQGASLHHQPVTISASLRRNSLFGGAGNYPAREVALLVAAVNHPRILSRHAERLAAISFESRDLRRLAGAMIDGLAESARQDDSQIRLILVENGLESILMQAEAALSPAEWWARPEAELQSAEFAWLQAAGLHDSTQTLLKALKEAELRFADEGSDGALSQIRAIKESIAALESGLTTLDGFGPETDKPAGR